MLQGGRNQAHGDRGGSRSLREALATGSKLFLGAYPLFARHYTQAVLSRERTTWLNNLFSNVSIFILTTGKSSRLAQCAP